MFCDVPRSVASMMGELGLTHRTYYRRYHLEPLMRNGMLRMTHPDQTYVLTEVGARFEARRVNGETEK